jgi:hypothetical protein
MLVRERTLLIALASMACGIAAAADFHRLHPCQAETGAGREQRFATLVCARTTAIETAFGTLFEGRELDIHLKFPASDDPGYPRTSMSSYDPAEHTLYFRRAVLGMTVEGWHHWILVYWPYYRSELAREEYPVIGVVDDALWNAHLRHAAHERGLTWPHEDCGMLDIGRRLGCEMLVSATAELLHSLPGPLFNTNRVDRLWPEDLQEFERRAWIRRGREYREVRRLGGLLLIEPLVREFGASRVFAYVARTPFRIEDDNVRRSALRYQDQARSALAW